MTRNIQVNLYTNKICAKDTQLCRTGLQGATRGTWGSYLVLTGTMLGTPPPHTLCFKVLYVTATCGKSGREKKTLRIDGPEKTDRKKGRDFWRKPVASERETGEENSGSGGGGWMSLMDFDSAIYSWC